MVSCQSGADVKTKDKILLAAQRILAEGGVGALAFDSIARDLGVSKQAILYWFPTKQALLAALFVAWAKDEADAAVAALSGTVTASEAIAGFVRAVARFHLGHLARFRLMYLVPQTIRPAEHDPADREILSQIHEVTDRLYGSLANRLCGPPAEARKQAVAIHSATLGLAMLVGLAESIGDPLKHQTDDLLSALVDRLTS